MKRLRAQSLSEYSFSLAIVLIAVIAMNVYVKRGLQGRYRDVMDATISAVGARAGQYEPYYVTAETNIEVPRNISTRIDRGRVTRNLSATSTKVKGHNTEGVNPD